MSPNDQGGCFDRDSRPDWTHICCVPMCLSVPLKLAADYSLLYQPHVRLFRDFMGLYS